MKLDERGLSSTSVSFLACRERVLAKWEKDTRAQVSGARDLLYPVLLNTLPIFFDHIAEALTRSYPRALATSHNTAASAHGGERARMTDFGPDQVIQEYQLLREAIRTETAGRVELLAAEWAVIDSSINSAILEAVRAFMSAQRDLRKRVAATLSHDMRSPLAVISNGAALITMGPDSAITQRAAARIESSARRLGLMLEELIDALTDQIGESLFLSLSKFDIMELSSAVAEEFNESGLGTLQVMGSSVEGYWCKDAMRRALENLTDNARKYGDGEIIRVRCERAHERLLLTVHNTGVHIPEERQSRIFDYLQRDSQSADASGWGIGLQFVKRVAEAHGGSVSVDSSPATGTSFLIDIPVDGRPFARPSS